MTEQWIGRRSRKAQLKLRAELMAELDAFAAANRVSRAGAVRLLLGLARHGFNAGVIREVNGRCNTIHLTVAGLKQRAQPGSQSLRELIAIDGAARDVSAMMVPMEHTD